MTRIIHLEIFDDSISETEALELSAVLAGPKQARPVYFPDRNLRITRRQEEEGGKIIITVQRDDIEIYEKSSN